MPTTLPPLRAFVFDAYATLFDVHSVTATAEALFPGQGTTISTLWRAKQLEYTWLRSLMDRYRDFWEVTEAALRYTCMALRLVADDGTIARLMDAYLHLTLYPDVLPTLEALAGRPLAILSNGAPTMLQTIVTNTGLTDYFAHILSVDTVSIYKPDPLVYDLAAARLDLAPREIGFVSANCWDVLGAASYGFNAFWVNRANAPLDQLGATPTAILKTLRDLPREIGQV